MQLRLDLFLAKCDIDYDEIWFYKDCFAFPYNDLIMLFDIQNLIVTGFYIDAKNCFIVFVDDRYINEQ